MASQLFENFLEGVITDAPLAAGATTINSAAFANLPVVTGGNTLVLILDPEAAGNGPELVTVSAHAASATSVTVGATSSEHAVNTVWVHALDADWLDKIEAFYNADSGAATAAAAASAAAAAVASDLSTHEAGEGGHQDATASQDGLMTKEYAAKLDGIDAGAKNDQVLTGGTDIGVVGGPDYTINHDAYVGYSIIENDGKFVSEIDVTNGHITKIAMHDSPQGDGDYQAGVFNPGSSEGVVASWFLVALDSRYKHKVVLTVTATGTIPSGSWMGVRAKVESTQSYMAQQANDSGTAGRGTATATIMVNVPSGATSAALTVIGQRGGSAITSGTWMASAIAVAIAD